MGELIQKEPLLPGKGEIDQINLVSSKFQSERAAAEVADRTRYN